MFTQFDPTPVDPNAALDDTFNLDIHNSGSFTQLPTLHGFIDPVNNTAEFPTIQVVNFYGKQNQSTSTLYNADINRRINDINQFHDIGLSNLVLLKPKSIEDILLGGSSIHDKPIIRPMYFNEKEDMETMIAAVRYFISYSKTNAFSKVNGNLFK